jgi:PAS domain S-box-containing protein
MSESRPTLDAARLRNLFETMTLGVVFHDRDGRIVEANPAACRILGLTPDEILGRSSIDPRWKALREDGSTFPGDEHPAMMALRTGKEVRDVVMGVFDPRRDEIRWLLVTAFPETRDGETEPVQAYSTFSDITERRVAADAVRRSEEKFRSIVESSPMGIYLYRLELDGRLVFTGANPAADKILGVDNRQFIGKTIEEAFPPLAETEVPARYRLVCEQGTPWRSEQIDYEDDQIRGAFEVHAFRTGPATMAVLFLDITDRKRVEEALRESEENYREIFNATSDAIFIHDADTGAILDVNRAMLDMYGLTRDEALRLTPDEASLGKPPYSAAEVATQIRRATEIGPQIFEWRARKKSGETFWAEVALRGTVIGGKDRVLAAVRDITERKEVEEALQGSERRYRTLFESAGEGIFLTKDLTLVDCNPKAVEMFGRPRSELIGLTPVDLSPSKQPDGSDSMTKVEGLLERLGESGGLTFEWTHQRLDGTTFDAEVALSALNIGGERFMLAHVRDVTEQKRLEERLAQAQKMETVGQLAGGVAHDFNNLLAPILGYAELLLRDFEPDDPRRTELDEIRRAAERARTLTRQLLAFSRKQVLEMKALDLAEVVSDFRKMLSRTIREDIDIKIEAAPVGPILGDVHQIEQVVMNLALNARDSMSGPGTLTLEIAEVELDEGFLEGYPEAEPGRYVMLAATDTGTGMDDETLDRIFEPFFTTKEIGKGTGLGLATVYGIVKQHRGIVVARSRLGAGSRFEVYLPRVKDPEEEDDPTPIPRIEATGSETIVVVEDDDMVRDLTCRILRTHGYRVIDAANASDCIEMFESRDEPVDLLLTDVVMPDLNGRQLYEVLSAVRPGLRVLYMSGYTDDVIASHGVLEDGVHLIQKPFSVIDLARKVREVLSS